MNLTLARIPEWIALRDAARKVREKAWAPYSKYHVGAAVLTDSGEIFTGCNVENALCRASGGLLSGSPWASGLSSHLHFVDRSAGPVWGLSSVSDGVQPSIARNS